MTHQLNFIYNDSDWICPSEYPDLSNAKDKSVFDEATGFAMSVKQGEVEVKTEQKEEEPKPLPKEGIVSEDNVPF